MRKRRTHISRAVQPRPRVQRVPEHLESAPEPVEVEEQSARSWIPVVQLAVILATFTVLTLCGVSLQEAAGVIGAGLMIMGDLRNTRP
ncbi:MULTISPECIES: hypothetical protein [unclassified Streptomyces]|uniref:hypothetical protein n=1 Tax=unclassified Streptomyces TaxID=2593676 RepID=UPI0038058559